MQDAERDEGLRAIRAAYPDLVVQTVRAERGGQRSSIIVVNGSLIFRFGGEGLRSEIAALRALKGRLPLPIPDPQYERKDTFVGYARLPGEPLWRETFLALDDATREQVAAQLAGFLRALHRTRIDVDLPMADSHELWVERYARISEKLFPLMRPDRRDAVAQRFEQYLQKTIEFQPVLRHGDFGPGNIMFDPKQRHVSGVVDFGSVALGDPAVDIASLIGPFGYGEPFLSLLAKDYPRLDELAPRARFYAGTFALQEALWGWENNDKHALESGLALYR